MMASMNLLRRCLLRKCSPIVTFCSAVNIQPLLPEAPQLTYNTNPVKYSKFECQPYQRQRIDVNERLAWLSQHPYTHPVDHPKMLIFSMERRFLEELLSIYENKTKITEDILSNMYSTAIKNYESSHLTPQFIVTMLSSFLCQYDLDWLRAEVVPLIPKVTAKLGNCSHLILTVCIASHSCQDDVQLTKEQDEFVCELYSQLKSHPDYDEEHQIHALKTSVGKVMASSSRWEEMVMECLQENETFSWYHSTLAKRALEERHFSFALQLLESGKDDLGTLIFTRNSFNHLLTNRVHEFASLTPSERLPELLDVLRKTELDVYNETALVLLNRWKNQLKFLGSDKKASYIKINERGQCTGCGMKLDQDDISAEELNQLKKEFYDRSIMEEGEFHLADPKTIADFVKWVSNRKPYDLVIDGLNAFYTNKPRSSKLGKEQQFHMAKQLHDLILASRTKRALIIIRSHATHHIPKSLAEVCDVYTLKDYAKDDVFSVYAALASGPQCYIVSSDQFRQHKKSLSALERKDHHFLFSRWQRLRQIPNYRDLLKLCGDIRWNVDFQYGYPLQTTCKPQVHSGCWHVPVYHPILPPNVPRFAYTQKWLCLPTLDS